MEENRPKRGSVEQKIRSIVAKMPDFEYYFGDYSQANVDLSNIFKPTVLYLLPPAGTMNLRREVFRDCPDTMIGFICPTEFDFDGTENDCRIERMKEGLMRFVKLLNESGLFEPFEGDIPYQVAYDIFDDGLTGVIAEFALKEVTGTPMCSIL